MDTAKSHRLKRRPKPGGLGKKCFFARYSTLLCISTSVGNFAQYLTKCFRGGKNIYIKIWKQRMCPVIWKQTIHFKSQLHSNNSLCVHRPGIAGHITDSLKLSSYTFFSKNIFHFPLNQEKNPGTAEVSTYFTIDFYRQIFIRSSPTHTLTHCLKIAQRALKWIIWACYCTTSKIKSN